MFVTVGGGNGVGVTPEGDKGAMSEGDNGVTVGGGKGGGVDAGTEGEEALSRPGVVDAGGGATFLWAVPSEISLEETGLDASDGPWGKGEVVVIIAAGLFSLWTRVLFLGLIGS